MQTFTLPCEAYYDSFAGLIKCVVLEATQTTPHMPAESTAWKLKVKITARNNPVYKAGEILNLSGIDDVFPRKTYHKTGIFKYVVSPYIWEEEK